ncbi:hypothetical protein Ciccas_007262 [Cichlidogyrus casuarinus]|uniref:Protein F37C4.5 n=1 Tax=Cichlidogyrus casuarinus TaxID=1844966 RepID=A0ABD2Q431_9PLAT
MAAVDRDRACSAQGNGRALVGVAWITVRSVLSLPEQADPAKLCLLSVCCCCYLSLSISTERGTASGRSFTLDLLESHDLGSGFSTLVRESEAREASSEVSTGEQSQLDLVGENLVQEVISRSMLDALGPGPVLTATLELEESKPDSHSPAISAMSNDHDDVPLEEEDDEVVYHDELEDEHEAKTFQQIREELETKDVTGSLQPQLSMICVSNGAPPSSGAAQQSQGDATPTGSISQPPLAPTTPPPSSVITRSGGQRPNNSETALLGNTRARLTYVIGDCAMQNLIVYPDKAHVYRKETPRFSANEVTEVLFTHVSPAINKDSVRVELRGRATILDVTLHEKSVEDDPQESVAQMQDEIRHCRKEIEVILSRISRAEKQRAVLDTYAEKMTGTTPKSDENGPVQCNGAPDEEHHHTQGKVRGKKVTSSATLQHLNSMAIGDKESVINPYDPRMMDTLSRFLSTYEEKANVVDSLILDGEEQIERLKARIEYVEKHIHEVELKHDDSIARDLSVIVEPRETGSVEMIISYVVGRCTWKPAYDIRMFNSDGSMKIIYYGMVQQATGENWTQIPKMTLSTAQPALGGTVPQLGLQTVRYKQNLQAPPLASICSQHASRTKRYTGQQQQLRRSQRSQSQSINELDEVEVSPLPFSACIALLGLGPILPMDERQMRPRKQGNTMSRTKSNMEAFRQRPGGSTNTFDREMDIAEVSSVMLQGPATPASTLHRTMSTATQSRRNLGTSLLLNACPPSAGACAIPDFLLAADGHKNSDDQAVSVQFEVPRPLALIGSDNEPHRATVGLIDLQPHYDYVSVPKRCPYAFLKATAVNQSNFYLLPGQTNIYTDNTFIGKVDMRAVAPGEQFSCQLGAEHGIKVSYRPMFKCKEGGSSGSKCVMTFKQMIEVKNCFDRAVKLTVIDQVPISGEEKIKVSLLEPVIKHPEKYDRGKPIRMNKNHNVEWDLDLQSNEVRELCLKFSVEHPANEELEVSVAS